MPPLPDYTRSDLARAMGQDVDNSTFGNILRFLERPGFAVRATMQGNFTGALGNLAQMALDLPTGGFINRDYGLLSIANDLGVSDSRELTTRRDRPQFSDVLKTWDMPEPKSFWGKLGTDVVGGILTDPLTYLGGTGLGKGIGKGALAGAKRSQAARKVWSALSAMPEGRKALSGASEEILETMFRRGVSRKPFSGTRADWVASLPVHGRTKIKFLVEERAAEKVFWESVRVGNPQAGEAFMGMKKAMTPSYLGDLNEGIMGMERASLVPTHSQMYARIPFTEIGGKIPGTADFWPKVGRYGTAPGWAKMALSAFPHTKPIGEASEALGRALMDKVRSSFISRYEYLGQDIAQGFRERAYRYGDQWSGQERRIAGVTQTVFGKWDIEDSLQAAPTLSKALGSTRRQLAGQAYSEAEDLFNQAVLKGDNPAWLGATHSASTHAFRRRGIPRPALSDEKDRARYLVKVFPGSKKGGELSYPRGPAVRSQTDLTYTAEEFFDEQAQIKLDMALSAKKVEALKGEADLASMTRDAMAPYVKDAKEALAKAKALEQGLPRTSHLLANAQADLAESRADLKRLLKKRRRLMGMKIGRTNRLKDWQAREKALSTRLRAGEKALDQHVYTPALSKTLLANITALPEFSGLDKAAVKEGLDLYQTEMVRIADELKALGIWGDLRSNPFYLPHQLSTVANELIDSEAEHLLKSPDFLKLRDHGTSGEFQKAVKEFASKGEVDLSALQGFDLQETDLGNLLLKRVQAHNQTRYRKLLSRDMAELTGGKGGVPGLTKAQNENLKRTYGEYLRHQFASLGDREGTLEILLGGGKFSVPVKGSSALNDWAKAGGEKGAWVRRRVVTRDGIKKIEVVWPGLNSIYKPLLTSFPTNIAYHVRNMFGAMFMGSFDPDHGGHKMFSSLWGAVRDAPIVNLMGRKGYGVDEISDAVRFLQGDRAALDTLKKSGKLWGGRYTWGEVGSILDETMGIRAHGAQDAINSTDLAVRMGSVDKLGREILDNGPWAARSFRQLVNIGMDWADSTEFRFRSTMLLNLLGKGVDKTEAIQRVGRAFVDYKVSSVTERWIRDVIPFAKFFMASTRWAKNIANTPKLVNWAGFIRESGREEDLFLPERVEDSLALPLPWKDEDGNRQFLLGLGLPIETTLNIMSVATPQGFRRQVLGAVNPVLRMPMEKVANRSFYFGDEWGRYRKKPNWLPSALATEVNLADGRVRYEISGAANEWINAAPTSRILGIVDKALASNRPAWSKVLNLTTGAKVLSVDEERELRLRLADYLKDKARAGEVGETLNYFQRLDPEDTPESIKVLLSGIRQSRARKRKAREERTPRGLGSRGLGL